MKKRDKNNKIIRAPEPSLEQLPVIDKCKPCVLHENSLCLVYRYPPTAWKNGDCPALTNSKFKRMINK